MMQIKKCPICEDAWIYASVGDYGSGYEKNGYRINCRCGMAWKAVGWSKTKEDAIKQWSIYLEDMEDE